MSEYNKEFDFYGEMNKNIDYFLLDSSSSEKNELIKSKIEKYKTVSEFFEHYSNNNIISLFDSFNRLDKMYSNIFFNNNNNNLKSKIDKYISDLSSIILLFNLISKNQQIIKKAISNSEFYLKNFYSENHINKDCQKKFDDYFDNLINLKKRKKKKRLSFLKHDIYFNKCTRHKTVKARKPNIFNLNKKNEDKNININYKIINFSHLNHTKHNSMDDEKSNIRTPKFPSKNEDPNNNSQSVLKENDSNKIPIIKQESINSFFTLASKAVNINSNSDENRIKKIKKEKKVKINDKKVTHFNLKNIHNDDEAKLIYNKSNLSENKKSQDNSEELEQKEYYTKQNPKKQTFSSVNLKTTMEKNMLKDFLGFINNIYKSGSINTEEKIKLKQLIISKSEKIENIYNNYYHHNKNEFINEIKKLIIQ